VKNSNTKVTPIASLTPYGAGMATMKLTIFGFLLYGTGPGAGAGYPLQASTDRLWADQRLPGVAVKYLSNLPSTPFQLSASAGASPLRVMLGQLAE